MESIRTILVAIERAPNAQDALIKAICLARRSGAAVEMFFCDSVRAFALDHQYDTRGVDQVRQYCVEDSRRYLQDLLASVDSSGVEVTINAVCETPSYEGISRKVMATHPDLVVRNMGGAMLSGEAALSENDWNLARACAAPLLLTRGSPWARHPVVCAAVDISSDEGPELTRSILRAANSISAGCEGAIDVLYCASDVGRSGPSLIEQREELRTRVEDARVPADSLHIVVGDPLKNIREEAAVRAYDIVALGALTHRPSLASLVGTLTGKLLETLSCDFLLVKTAGHTHCTDRGRMTQASLGIHA